MYINVFFFYLFGYRFHEFAKSYIPTGPCFNKKCGESTKFYKWGSEKHKTIQNIELHYLLPVLVQSTIQDLKKIQNQKSPKRLATS